METAEKIRVGAVSYLNTKPLLWGMQQPDFLGVASISLDYPAQLAAQLRDGELDVALLPVAAIPTIPEAHIVGHYGIAADGAVASVALFSQVPMEEINTVLLDYQSRTSIRLARLLLAHCWRQDVELLPAGEDYITRIQGTTAGVIIGDRAFENLSRFPFVYDLAEAWNTWTGLPFVFAAWVANKELPARFIDRLNGANALGLSRLPEIAEAQRYTHFDLLAYYRDCIQYELTEPRMAGLRRFLALIEER